MNVATGAIGAALDRIEGAEKVTGAAPYAYEHDIDGVAYGAIISSTIAKGAVVPWAKSQPPSPYYMQVLGSLAREFGFSLETPWRDLPEEIHRIILHGTEGRPVTLRGAGNPARPPTVCTKRTLASPTSGSWRSTSNGTPGIVMSVSPRLKVVEPTRPAPSYPWPAIRPPSTSIHAARRFASRNRSSARRRSRSPSSR